MTKQPSERNAYLITRVAIIAYLVANNNEADPKRLATCIAGGLSDWLDSEMSFDNWLWARGVDSKATEILDYLNREEQ